MRSVIATILFLFPASVLAQERLPLEVVAVQGDVALGGERLGYIWRISVSPTGEVLLHANYDTPGPEQGIFMVEPGQAPRLFLSRYSPVPGDPGSHLSGLNVRSRFDWQDGMLLMYMTADDVWLGYRAVVQWPSGEFETLAAGEGDASAILPGATYATVHPPAKLGDGVLLFTGLRHPSFGRDERGAFVYYQQGQPPQVIAIHGGAPPDCDGRFVFPSTFSSPAPRWRASGGQAFAFDGRAEACAYGIWRVNSDSALSTVAHSGRSGAVGLPGGVVVYEIEDLRVGASGHVLFWCTLWDTITQRKVGEESNTALIRTDADGTPRVLVRERDPAPGRPGYVLGYTRSGRVGFERGAVGPEGSVAIVIDLVEQATAQLLTRPLYIIDEHGMREIIHGFSRILGREYSAVHVAGWNNARELAIVGRADFAPDQSSLIVYSNGRLIPIVVDGDIIQTRPGEYRQVERLEQDYNWGSVQWTSDRRLFANVRFTDGTTAVVQAQMPCLADMDLDFHLSPSDYWLFLDYFTSGDPAADLDFDGQFTMFDQLEYLRLFSLGCP